MLSMNLQFTWTFLPGTVFHQTFNSHSHDKIKIIIWPTPSKPAISVEKYYFRFIDAENAKILSSKMIYHTCHFCSKFHPWKVNIPLENSLFSIDLWHVYWPVSHKVFWWLTAGFVGVGHISQIFVTAISSCGSNKSLKKSSETFLLTSFTFI